LIEDKAKKEKKK